MEVHRQDGLSFVLNVGNHSLMPIVNSDSGLPSCESSLFVTSHQVNPACKCYVDADAPLQSRAIIENAFCSRPHLCIHKMSQQANLDSYKYTTGMYMGLIDMPQAAVSVTIAVVVLNVVLVVFVQAVNKQKSRSFERNKERKGPIENHIAEDPLLFHVGHNSSSSSLVQSMSSMDSELNNSLPLDLPSPPPPPRGKRQELLLNDDQEFLFQSTRVRDLVDKLGEESSVESLEEQPYSIWRSSTTRSSILTVINTIFAKHEGDDSIVSHGTVQDKVSVSGRKYSYLTQAWYHLRQQCLSYSSNNSMCLLK
jgi:hypothetical protein